MIKPFLFCATVLQSHRVKLYSDSHFLKFSSSSDNSSTPSTESLASIIADAILRDPDAVPLVARSDDKDSRLDKDWVWMSEFDKDELVKKKILREL